MEKTLENSRDNKSSKPTKIPFYTLIKWSSIFAFVTAYTHFFGFSFAKGKLKEAGFYSSDISLDVNETLHEAAAATEVGLYGFANAFFSKEIFETSIFLAIGLPILFVILLVAPWLKVFFESRMEGKTDLLKKPYVNKFKKMGATLLISVIGFLLPYLVNLGMILLISVAWLGMTIGENLGKKYTADLIENKVCYKLDDSFKGIVAKGCMTIKLNDDSKISGRILHQESSRIFFLTNNGSYLLNAEHNILYSSCFYRKGEDDFSKEYTSTCMARCEVQCRVEINASESEKQ